MLALILPLRAADKPEALANSVAALVNPAKLASLKDRGAIPRVQKYTAQLALAKQDGNDPDKVAAEAVALAGMKGESAKITLEAMLRNLRIAEALGCTDEAGLKSMRHGQAATVQRGPYQGEQLSVDHIIPRKVAPELDNVIANLELMPLRMNASKSASVGDRQVSLAKRLRKAGLLSKAGYAAVTAAQPKHPRSPAKKSTK